MREPSPSGRVVSQGGEAPHVYAVDLYKKIRFFFSKKYVVKFGPKYFGIARRLLLPAELEIPSHGISYLGRSLENLSQIYYY